MAYIRVTADLLVHILDLPAGASIFSPTEVEGLPVLTFKVNVEPGSPASEHFQGERSYALQYASEDGMVSLTDVVPVTAVTKDPVAPGGTVAP